MLGFTTRCSISRGREQLSRSSRQITYSAVNALELNHKEIFHDEIYQSSFKSKEPLSIRGLAIRWKAVSDPARTWSNLHDLSERLISTNRQVRIECGENYMDDNIQTSVVSVSDYLQYLITSQKQVTEQGTPRVYLAQQNLEDVPELAADVETPRICEITGYRQIHQKNLWMCGARGSVSPCHYDPYDNVLVQIVGTKKVSLFNPNQSDLLYPALGTLQKNTSRVDIGNPDYDMYPQSRRLTGHEITLHPGDAVYIPKKWWHYCVATDVSASVNFWWV